MERRTCGRVVWGLVALVASSAFGQSEFVRANDDAQAKLQAYLDAAVEVLDFNGAVLVKHEGQVVLTRGLGKANFEWDIANTPDTKFRIGSITKSFTAWLVLEQVEQGQLKLDDPISRHLADTPEAWKPITIHHLLCHQSGLYNYTNSLEWMQQQATLSKPQKLVPIFRDKPLNFAPGEKFEYSNSGYVLLGLILEKLTGKSYETLVRERICEPFQLHDTGYDRPDVILTHRAAGYRGSPAKRKNSRFLDMASADSAGALYSTVIDLSKYDDALTAGRGLSADSYAKLFAPHKSNYAYGWINEESPGKPLIWHNGGINGFGSSLVRRPDTRSCAAVLSNVEGAPVDRIARELLAIVQGDEYRVPRKHTVAANIDPELYNPLVGSYQLTPELVIKVTRNGNRLMAQLTGQPSIEVFPESELEFFYKVVDAQLSFVRNDAGQVTQVILRQNGAHRRCDRKPAEEPAAAEQPGAAKEPAAAAAK